MLVVSVLIENIISRVCGCSSYAFQLDYEGILIAGTIELQLGSSFSRICSLCSLGNS